LVACVTRANDQRPAGWCYHTCSCVGNLPNFL